MREGVAMVNYINIEPVLFTLTEEWLKVFFASVKERPSYLINDSTYGFQRVGIRVLGTPLDQDEYYNALFEMNQESSPVHVLSEELDKTIDNQMMKSIQDILDVHQQEPKGLSINRLIAFMYGKQLIPKHHDPSLNRHIQLSVIKVIEHFQQHHSAGLLTQEFRRFLIDVVKWLKNHWAKWAETVTIGEDFPKVVWYGDMNGSQKYFLMLLMEFGCDVLLFHPEGKDLFAEIDPNNTLSIPYQYRHTAKLEPFPTHQRERQTTVAYRANKQLEIMMHDHGSGIYKPWQFRDYIPSSITLRMTYDDVFIYAREKAMIRPEFKLENNRVHIPVIFAKIQGVSKDRKQYWERMRELIDDSLALCIREFPFSQATKANYHFHYQKSLEQGTLSPEKMVNSNWWRYKHLPNGLQNAIAHTIKAYCEHPKLNKIAGESDYDLQLFLFKQANMMPEVVLQLLQKFDYAQEIPRLVLYNMEKNGEPSREDAALLLFLNEFGCDVIWYNPAGHNDIEQFINPSFYDVHWLEEVEFQQEFQEKEESIIKKIIKKIF